MALGPFTARSLGNNLLTIHWTPKSLPSEPMGCQWMWQHCENSQTGARIANTVPGMALSMSLMYAVGRMFDADTQAKHGIPEDTWWRQV